MESPLLTNQLPLPGAQPNAGGAVNKGNSFVKPNNVPANSPNSNAAANPASSSATTSNTKTFDQTLRDTSAQDTLNRIRALVPREQAITKDSPALALVSGQLENISPQDIPTVVSTNPFVNTALGSEDLVAFMQTPMPLGEILKALGLDKALTGKAVGLGINLGEMVSPKELLRALGLDPQRVVAELSLLKQNLPFEGIAPLMQRAAMLRGQNRPDAAFGMNTDTNLDNDIATPGKNRRMSAEDILAAGVIVPQAPGWTSVPQVQQNPTAPQDSTAVIASTSPLIAAKTGPKTPTAGSQNAAMPQLGITQLSAEAPTLAAPSSDSQMATARRTVQDPFKLLGEQMLQSGVDVRNVTMNAPKGVADTRLLEALIAQKMATAEPGDVKIGFPKLGQSEDAPDLSLTGWKTPEASVDTSLNGNLIAQPIVKLDASSTMMQELGRKPTEVGAPKFAKETDETDREIEPSFHNLTQTTTHDLGRTLTDTTSTVTNAAPSLSHPQNVDKLVNSAQMLVQGNGGSIRVDLETPEHGPLNVALHVDNGVVNLRVLTDSQDVRHILGQELPLLRESLSQQNLSLGRVDVGVDSGSNQRWAQSFSGHSNQRWNNHAAQDWQEMVKQSSKPSFGNSGIDSILSIPSVRPSYGSLNVTNTIRDGGRIQVAI